MRLRSDALVSISLTVFVVLTTAALGVALYNHETVLHALEASRAATAQTSADGIISRLQSTRKELFDSNTITFLFSLLVLTVVNLALYLHTRSLEAIRAAERKALDSAAVAHALTPLLDNASFSAVLSTLVSRAERLLDDLRFHAAEWPRAHAPELRDVLTQIRKRLQIGARKQLGLEPDAFEYSLDAVTRFDEILRRDETLQMLVGVEFLDRNKEILTLLLENDFLGWHRSVQETLNNVSVSVDR